MKRLALLKSEGRERRSQLAPRFAGSSTRFSRKAVNVSVRSVAEYRGRLRATTMLPGARPGRAKVKTALGGSPSNQLCQFAASDRGLRIEASRNGRSANLVTGATPTNVSVKRSTSAVCCNLRVVPRADSTVKRNPSAGAVPVSAASAARPSLDTTMRMPVTRLHERRRGSELRTRNAWTPMSGRYSRASGKVEHIYRKRPKFICVLAP